LKILLDLQGCQSASRHRGIGRYSLSLAKAMARNAEDHEIWLLMNGLYSDTVAPLKETFAGLVPPERIVVFHVPGPVAEMDESNLRRARVAELIREGVVAMIAPDVIHVSSLFEGFVDDAVTSIGNLPNGPPVAVTLYDLIPLLNSAHHFTYTAYKNHYLRKIESLKRADLLLAISASSGAEALRALGIESSRITNINSAVDEKFRPVDMLHSGSQTFQNGLGLTKPFLLSVGNVEPHKNILGLIEAFALLSPELRGAYQLAVVVNKDAHGRIYAFINSLEIPDTDVKLLSDLDDEQMVKLYNLCHLFVLPSLHEGFGLPALEAMACGAAAIGSNCTSIPEVIGRDDALFDPRTPADIARLIGKVLSDPEYHRSLRKHAQHQAAKFSWDTTARRALDALEKLVVRSRAKAFSDLPEKRTSARPRLAMVTPLPPERTGIADYCAELLPALSAHYDITLVTNQDVVILPNSAQDCVVHDQEWFEAHSSEFDRIVYQTGNSPFHAHMFDLLRKHPGIVVLHDFFLSGVLNWMESTGYKTNAFRLALLESHGYSAVICDANEGRDVARWRYPCNHNLVNNALGVITHSRYSQKIANEFYGEDYSKSWACLPQHRNLPIHINKAEARRMLGLPESDFVVCAFGFMDPSKLNHVLIEAWNESKLNKDAKCHLIFVGENDGAEYGIKTLEIINARIRSSRITITGYVGPELFKAYLEATDFAVQLRTLSRGETSRSVLDCLAMGIPVIINAHGSMAEYPDKVLVKLPDEFNREQLTRAIDHLYTNQAERSRLSISGRNYINQFRTPETIAVLYRDEIERFASSPEAKRFKATVDSIRRYEITVSEDEWKAVSTELAYLRNVKPKRRLFVDLSATIRTDLKTGIERVARAFLNELVLSAPVGFDVEPVYLTEEKGLWNYRFARNYYLRKIQQTIPGLTDELVAPRAGDVLICLDLFPEGVVGATVGGLYDNWKASGAQIFFMIYDLLPILHPHAFPEGADQGHIKWLECTARSANGLICISRSVANDLNAWIGAHSAIKSNEPRVKYLHLGADIAASMPTVGLPSNLPQIVAELDARPTFLMVGTIEPRKGHLQVINAFELLWKAGIECNLVIVGSEGWKPLPDSMRRTIPQIITKLRSHPELDKRLFWLEGITDEYLELIYASADCLIAASEGEGFGLPLIEAAQHKLPIIARDIPVFREVAGEHAYYFSGLEAAILADSIKDWIELNATGNAPQSNTMRWLTWRESCQQLVEKTIGTA
jgi:glycosyltransferase involved in cell wall biosynthesis